MAAGTMNREEIAQLLTGAPPGRPLPLVYLVDDDTNPTVRITAFLLRRRAGGFMVALPNLEQVSELLATLSLSTPDAQLYSTEAAIACETPRRRPVGDVTLLLADIPWAWLGLFRRGTAMRSSPLQLLSIMSGSTVVRPVLEAALEAAEVWIASAMGEPELQESMGEYATAAEQAEHEANKAEDEGEGPDAELARLRAQVAALELAAQTQPPPAAGARSARATGAQTRRSARDLFPEAGGTGLTPGDLARLQEAAGAPWQLECQRKRREGCLRSVSAQIRRLAAMELGESVEDPPASLLRTYFERRSPVGDFRTLALAARRSQNHEMESWFTRLALFVDQAATEGGRTQLAWLLGGLPEPTWTTMVRKRQGLKPFSKMCPSLWASANIAYLKELDWIGSRMASQAGGGQQKDEGDADAAPSTKPPRRGQLTSERTACETGRAELGPSIAATGVPLNSESLSFDPAGADPAGPRAEPMGAADTNAICGLFRCPPGLDGRLMHNIGCLNWLALGCPSRPPDRACVGTALTESQRGVLDTLERHCLHFLRAGRFASSTLGRSSEKFDLLFGLALELPQCDLAPASDVDRMLNQFVSALHADWDTYTRPRPFPKDPPSSQDDPSQATTRGEAAPRPASGSLGVCSLGSGASCKKVVADRIKWTLPPSFNPMPFFSDATTRRVYLDPNALRLPESLWPRLPRAQVHCSRAELLRLAAKWDAFQALRLVPCTSVPFHETVGCFGVAKDSSFDRFILNPVVANSRTQGLSKFTKLLAPGVLLTSAHLPSGDHVLRFNCDDLSEMYYTFSVSQARAQRNTLGVAFDPSELQQFSVYDPIEHNQPCYLSLGTLAMGDCHAVEFAQQSHFNVLGSLGGCMRPHEYVAYRRPVPRTSCLEFLSIDDHLTAQVCSRAQLKGSAGLRDTAIFEGAERAYPAVGLVQHPKKRQRNVTTGVFLGADADGIQGLVSAPRHRIGVLMRITATIARKGCCSSDLLSSVLGLWIHVLLFRRPALAVLQAVFEDARRDPRNSVLPLQRGSINELFCLCALGPLLQTDLRVNYPGTLFCMDASPTGAGLCAASLPPAVLKELWRHGEQKGFYTKLLEPASALLAELELSDDPGIDFARNVGACDFGARHFLRKYLFAIDPTWDNACLNLGLHRVPDSLSLAGLRFEDLASDDVFHHLRGLLTSGAVFNLHVSAPALSFVPRGRCRLRSCSSAAASHCRSGLLRLHNRLARRLCFLLCLAASSGVYFSVSQPAASLLFRLHCFRGLVALGGVVTRLFCCDFGAPYKRALLFLHNKPWRLLRLASSGDTCGCPPGAKHFPVRGTFSAPSVDAFCRACNPSASAVFGSSPAVGQSVSSFCAAYPAPLAHRIASGSALAASGYTFLRCPSLRLGLFHDDPEWISELADCLDFRELLRYKFRKGGHINILEARAYKTWIKWCSRRLPHSRLLGLIDSRVLLGAAAKGRPPPAPSKAFPAWLAALVNGVLGRWVRFLLLLAGDIERNPGPPSRLPRGSLDLQSGFATSTRHKMTKALDAFILWLTVEFGLGFDAAMSSSQSAACALRAFDRFPQYRSHLSPAWQIDRKWQLAEPGECRPLISQPILQAGIALALCWGWYDWAALTCVGFLCMLHPAEMIPLIRQDLVFPEDALSPDPVAYTCTYAALRRSGSRAASTLGWKTLSCSAFLRRFTSTCLWVPVSFAAHVYRRQWNSIMTRLGVPCHLSEKGEVVAQLLLHRLLAWSRERIRVLSSFSRPVCRIDLEGHAPCLGSKLGFEVAARGAESQETASSTHRNSQKEVSTSKVHDIAGLKPPQSPADVHCWERLKLFHKKRHSRWQVEATGHVNHLHEDWDDVYVNNSGTTTPVMDFGPAIPFERHCSESHRLERTCSIDSEGIIHNLEVLLAEVSGGSLAALLVDLGLGDADFAGFGFSAWLRIRGVWPVGRCASEMLINKEEELCSICMAKNLILVSPNVRSP
ncbi:unnamed protein product [Symbiodinium sp. CCMP2592]|nr:unnamed protein product [Symbiodinium sp. CCMP2592]